MKKVIFAALAMAAFSAHASGPSNNNNSDNITNNYDQRNYGGNTSNAGGAGGNAASIAGASSAAEAKANAAAIAAQQQGQAQGQQQYSNSASGVIGSGNSGGNKLEGNKTSTNVSVGGDNYEAAASSVIAAPIPTVAKSCRLYMFGGATDRDGAVSGSIPLGNDQTCLSGINMNNMLRSNDTAQKYGAPMPFTIDDIVAQACKTEGMEDVPACKSN